MSHKAATALFASAMLVVTTATYAAERVVASDLQAVWRLDIDASLTRFDAAGNDEFHSTQTLSMRAGYYFNRHLAIEGGAILNNRALDETRKDIAGYYQASVDQQSLLLGFRSGYRFSAPFEVYARLGATHAWTELEVEEVFETGIPAQTVSASDRTFGYYYAIGGTHFITPTIEVHLELSRQTQPDLFSGDSDIPFDLEATSFGIGLGLLF